MLGVILKLSYLRIIKLRIIYGDDVQDLKFFAFKEAINACR